MSSEEMQQHLYIRWQDSFLLGIPKIDEQHKQLVSLCNILYQTIMNNQKVAYGEDKWHNSLEQAIRNAVKYIHTHFQDEEKLMQAAQYLGYKNHKKQHDDFIKKVLETAQSLDTSTIITGIQFVKFLYEWILGHIAYEDKLYVKPVLEYYRTIKK